jgi:nicotinamide riboside kinase
MSITALLLGGECTGKTHLALALAKELASCGNSSLVIPEVLRTFVEEKGRTPLEEDQPKIWQAQSDALASGRARGTDVVICDPAPLMTAVYSIQYFDDSSLLDKALAQTSDADLIIWCRPDITWEPDGPHRDGPQVRQATDQLLQELVIPHIDEHRLHLATGSGRVRVEAASAALLPLLN